MPKIRILIVDDSVVVRRMVSDALASDPQLEVIGAAANGKIALAKIPQVNPDIVILDVEMPELDGIGTLVGIRKSLPHLPVIMYSTLTQRGAEATLEALSKGATDYVTKPSNVGSAAQGLECIRTQLIPKIKAICGRVLGFPVSSPLIAAVASKILQPPLSFPRREERIDIVAIGVSTGGPNSLANLMPAFPQKLSRTRGYRSTHASRLHPSPGGALGCQIANRRGGGLHGGRPGTWLCLDSRR